MAKKKLTLKIGTAEMAKWLRKIRGSDLDNVLLTFSANGLEVCQQDTGGIRTIIAGMDSQKASAIVEYPSMKEDERFEIVIDSVDMVEKLLGGFPDGNVLMTVTETTLTFKGKQRLVELPLLSKHYLEGVVVGDEDAPNLEDFAVVTGKIPVKVLSASIKDAIAIGEKALNFYFDNGYLFIGAGVPGVSWVSRNTNLKVKPDLKQEVLLDLKKMDEVLKSASEAAITLSVGSPEDGIAFQETGEGFFAINVLKPLGTIDTVTETGNEDSGDEESFETDD